METCIDFPQTLRSANEALIKSASDIKKGSDEYLDEGMKISKSLSQLLPVFQLTNNVVEAFIHNNSNIEPDVARDIKILFSNLLNRSNKYIPKLRGNHFYECFIQVHSSLEDELLYLNEQYDDFLLKFFEIPGDEELLDLLNNI